MTCVEDGCRNNAVGVTAYCEAHHAKNWHGWFAWFPVLTLEGQWVWMELVIRKRIVPAHDRGPWWQRTFWYRVLD